MEKLGKIESFIYSSPLQLKKVVIHPYEEEMLVQSFACVNDKQVIFVGISLRSVENKKVVLNTIYRSIGSDPIRAWRAALILAAVPDWDEDTFFCAIEATRRDSTIWSSQEKVSQMVQKLGAKYQEILSTPVPEKLIEQAVKRSRKRAAYIGLSYSPLGELKSAQEEIELGLLQWRKDFELFGIPNPTQKEQLLQITTELIAKYQFAFQALEQDFGLVLKNDLDVLKQTLLFLSLMDEKEELREYGNDVKFGFAFMLAHNSTRDGMQEISHWLPGIFRGKTSFTNNLIYWYSHHLLELRYHWYGYKYQPSD